MSKILNNMLELALNTREVLYVEGVHGIGKSEMIEAWAKEKGMHCVVLELATQEVGDLIGIPHIVNGVTSWAMPDWLDEVIQKDKEGISTVLFMDEFNRSRVEVKAAIMNTVLHGRMHTHQIPKSTLIVTAGNPDGKKYQVSKTDPALMNRLLHMTLQVNPTEWLEYATNKKVHSAILTYIRKNEDKLWFQDDHHPASATPRSWKRLSDNLQHLEFVQADEDAIRTTVIGKLGIAVGGPFFNYYKERSRQLEPKDIIDFVKKHDKECTTEKEYQAHIEDLAEKLEKKIGDVEHILLQGVAERMIKSYSEVGITGDKLKSISDKRNVLPLGVLLTAMPLEVAASIFEQFKTTDEYKILYNFDINFKLCCKLVAIKTKNDDWLKNRE